jgi:uncharacterized protein (DUF302 family)
MIDRNASWEEVLAEVSRVARHGFLIYWRLDEAGLMRLAGDAGACTAYLMGDHTTAERMYRHNPAVMLYTPLRSAIYVGEDERTYFEIDQPSAHFSSFGDPAITEVGRELDAKLAALLDALAVPVPNQLREVPVPNPLRD